MSQYDRTETINLRLVVTNSQARTELAALDQSFIQLTQKQKTLTKGTKEYIATGEQLKKVEKRMGELRKVIGLNGLTMKQLTDRARKLSIQLKHLTPDTAEWNRLNTALHATKKRMAQLRSGLGPMGRAWKKVSGDVRSFAVNLAGVFAVGTMIAGVRSMIMNAGKLSDVLADVRKTTNLSEKAVRELNGELKKIDTRTSRHDLLMLARDAGKLGIEGVKNIAEFVKAANQIEVALGEDLGDDAIKQIGKINELFDVTALKGYEGGMLATGSAINAVGQASTANEGFLVDYTKRLGGIADQADIVVADIIGYGSATDQLGQNLEVSSTTMSKTIVAMFKDTAHFAKIAGVSTADFAKLLKEDTNEAFLVFLDGLNGNNEGLGEMVKKFEDLGLNGDRSIKVLSAMAGNTDLIREAQALANEEFEKATSLTDEYNIKNENAQANMEKLGKIIRSVFVNHTLIDGINKIVKGLLNLAKWSKENVKTIKTVAKAIYITVTAWTAYKIAVLLSSKATLLALRSSKIYRIGMLLLTGKIKLATVATRIFNTVTKLNPLGLILALLASATAAYFAFRGEVAKNTDSQKALNEELERTAALKAQDLDIEARMRLVGTMNLRQLEAMKASLEERKKIMEDAHLDFLQINKREVEEIKAHPDNMAVVNRFMRKIFADRTKLFDTENQHRALRAEDGKFIEAELTKFLNGEYETRTDAYLKSVEAQVKIQKERAKNAGAGDGDGTSPYDALLANFKRYRQNLENSQLEGAEKEIAILIGKFEQWKVQAAGNHDALLQAEDNFQFEFILIQDKWERKRAKEREDVEDEVWMAQQSANDKALIQEMQKWDRIITRAEEHGIDTVGLVESSQRAISALTASFNKKDEDEQERHLTEKEKRQKEHLEKMQGQFDEAAEAFGGLASFYGGISEFMAATGQENSKFYKHIVGMELAMSSASAIAGAVSLVMNSSTTWYEALAAMGTMIGTIGTNIAKAKSIFDSAEDPPSYTPQPVPEYGSGGRFLDEGTSHDHPSRGMPIVNPLTGRVVARIEKGEGILSKKFMKNNPTLAAAAMAASKSGRKIEGVPDASKMRFLNYDAINQASMSRTGGRPQYSAPETASSAGNSDVVAEIAAMRKDMKSWNRDLKARVSMKQMNNEQDKYNDLLKRNTVGKYRTRGTALVN